MFDEEIVVIDDANSPRQADVNFQCPIANLPGKVHPKLSEKLPTCTNIHKITPGTLGNRSSCSRNEEEISEEDNSIRAKDLSRKSDTSVIMEDIELESLEHRSDLDFEVIGDDLIESTTNSRDESEERSAFCYTPERLVRSREYSILIPSPKYLFESPKIDCVSSPFAESRPETPKFRRKLEDLIDFSQIGASQLEALLDSTAPEIRVPLSIRRSRHKTARILQEFTEEVSPPKDLLEIANRESPTRYETPEPASSDSSVYGCLCNSFEDREKSSRSVDDTSGIQSNTWSESGSGFQSPVYLSMEVTKAAGVPECQHKSRGVINQVVTLLDGLQKTSDPEKVDCLIQDRFCPNSSTHDYLTRLALSIEVEDDPESIKHARTTKNEFEELRERVQQLQENSRDMCRDMKVLRMDFQCEERKLDNLQTETSRVHKDINELRYLDDLLNLLRGELARISRRNWPFVLGHDDYDEEINLVV